MVKHCTIHDTTWPKIYGDECPFCLMDKMKRDAKEHTHFHMNCCRRRKEKAKICSECPFKILVGDSNTS